MKKLTALLLAVLLILTFTACSGGTEETTTSSDNTDTDTVTNPTADALLSEGELDTGMKEKFDRMEYAAYVDLFYNDNGASYEGKTFTKDGTFAILTDAYNDTTRYYVWGYADNTKCCDYQWEIVLPEGTEIPEAGSYVKVNGTMEKNDEALDGYWLKDVTLEITDEFTNAGYDMDMTTMSPTLTRVEIINMLQFPEKFNDVSIRIFGRALSGNSIQHPYYNDSWSMHFTETDTVPATGKYILLEGTYNKDGTGNLVTTSALTVIG